MTGVLIGLLLQLQGKNLTLVQLHTSTHSLDIPPINSNTYHEYMTNNDRVGIAIAVKPHPLVYTQLQST